MNLMVLAVRRMTHDDLMEVMESCGRLSRIASVSPAFHAVEAWIDDLGDNCSEEMDRRLRAKEYHAQQLTKSKPVQRDLLTSAFFGGIGGAAPDAEHREGYPTDQTMSPECCDLPDASMPNPACQASRGAGLGVPTVPPAP